METYTSYKQIHEASHFANSLVEGRLPDSAHCIALIKCCGVSNFTFWINLSDPALGVLKCNQKQKIILFHSNSWSLLENIFLSQSKYTVLV